MSKSYKNLITRKSGMVKLYTRTGSIKGNWQVIYKLPNNKRIRKSLKTTERSLSDLNFLPKKLKNKDLFDENFKNLNQIVKEYWMEGSMRAHNMRRYAQTKDNFFEEGISGYVPHVGSIFDKLPIIVQMLRATLATTGCKTIEELHSHAVLEKQSPSALLDSKIHDIVPMNIDQQVL